MQELTKSPELVCAQIVEALAGGLTQAAKIYHDYVEAGGSTVELQRFSGISSELWATLDDVATGRVDVRVFCLPSSTQKPIKMLPGNAQREVLDRGIEVAAADGSSITVQVAELTGAQRRQVFYRGRVRTVSEQAAWMKSRWPDPSPIDEACVVRKGLLVVTRPTKITMHDLHRYLALMG